MRRLVLLALGGLVLFSAPLGAATRSVCAAGCDSSSLQATLNTAMCGDVITLKAGETITGNFNLPNVGDCTGNPVTLRTDALSNIPPVGTRLCIPLTVNGHPEQSVRCVVDHSASMPKIVSSTTPILTVDKLARGWSIIGVEFSYINTATTSSGTMIFMGFEADRVTQINSNANLPDTIYFEHVYIHGSPAGGTRRGVLMNAKRFTLRDSVIRHIQTTGSQSNALNVYNSPGPFVIDNNEINTAATQGLLSGGATPGVTNQVNCDWKITNNLFTRPLTAWSGDASYEGSFWVVGNQIEFKNGCRVNISHNILEYSWPTGQIGTLAAFISLNDDAGPGILGCTWCNTSAVTFENNILRHANSAFALVGQANFGDPLRPPPVADGIIIRNNLIYDISPRWNWRSGCPAPFFCGVGRPIQLGSGYRNVTFSHNTIDNQDNYNSYGIQFVPGGALNKPVNFTFKDNFIWRGISGMGGDGEGTPPCGGEGQRALDSCVDKWIFLNNVYADGGFAGGSPPASPAYPATTVFIDAATWNATFANKLAGDYRLNASSPFKAGRTNGASDGTDIGVNMCNGAFPDPAGDGKGTFGCQGAMAAPTHLRIIK